jgi:hypothetical protein
MVFVNAVAVGCNRADFVVGRLLGVPWFMVLLGHPLLDPAHPVLLAA